MNLMRNCVFHYSWTIEHSHNDFFGGVRIALRNAAEKGVLSFRFFRSLQKLKHRFQEFELAVSKHEHKRCHPDTVMTSFKNLNDVASSNMFI
jgi:hypothetical protein